MNRPSLLRARMRTRVNATPQAAIPIRKRTKATCAPGSRAAATFVASAMTANPTPAPTTATPGRMARRSDTSPSLLFLLGLASRRLGGLGGALAGGLHPVAGRVLPVPQPEHVAVRVREQPD